MRVLRHYLDVPASARAIALALGNFDGVHRGHQAVISATRRFARELGAPLGVLTFDPSPRSFFNPNSPSGQIASLDQKIERFAALGVHCVYALRFDHLLANMSPEQFVTDVLHQGIGARHVVTGYDYRFGRRRAGDTTTLRHLCEERGIAFTAVAPAGSDGAIFSSTAIRDALRRGAPEDAAHILGAPWELCAPIDRILGEARWPAVAVRIGRYLQPARGAYAVAIRDDEGWRCDATVHVGDASGTDDDLIYLELSAPCPRRRGDRIRIDFLRRAPGRDHASEELLTIESMRSVLAPG